MILRELKEKDAEYMLEWMHDKNVSDNLEKDFSKMTIQNCKDFIANTYKDSQNKHYAIVDECDEYMGTISLKNIDYENKRAEYAISCRTKAIGNGFSKRATEEIFNIASDMGLELIYLYVRDSNLRAQKFYEKTGFLRMGKPQFSEEDKEEYMWFYRKLD